MLLDNRILKFLLLFINKLQLEGISKVLYDNRMVLYIYHAECGWGC